MSLESLFCCVTKAKEKAPQSWTKEDCIMLEGARQSASTHTTKLHHQDFSKRLVPEAGPRGWELK